MTAEVDFLNELATGIAAAGGVPKEDHEGALRLAADVLAGFRNLEPLSYPNIVEVGGLRFVYQWDEMPPVVTVMLWDDEMWRDMARVEVPGGLL